MEFGDYFQKHNVNFYLDEVPEIDGNAIIHRGYVRIEDENNVIREYDIKIRHFYPTISLQVGLDLIEEGIICTVFRKFQKDLAVFFGGMDVSELEEKIREKKSVKDLIRRIRNY